MAERLRIAHAVHSAGFAGVERYIATLASAQTVAGHDVVVIGGGNPDAFRVNLDASATRYVEATRLSALVRELNRLDAVDILHVHMTAAEVAAALALRVRRVPVVATRHFAARRGSTPAGRLATLLIRRRLAAQIAISQFVADHIDGASTVVVTGVEDRRAAPTARRSTFLIAQRLEPEKETAVAIEAFALSHLAHQGWRLLVAGSGSCLPALKALALQEGLEARVEFLGERADVPDLMSSEGMLIAPCPAEGLGLSALEAMAAGMPVLAAGAGGHLETVGLSSRAALFSPGDARALADHMLGLAGDDAARAAYGGELRSLQQSRFSVAEFSLGVERVYRGALDVSGASTRRPR